MKTTQIAKASFEVLDSYRAPALKKALHEIKIYSNTYLLGYTSVSIPLLGRDVFSIISDNCCLLKS